MNNTLRSREYSATVDFNSEDQVFHGKVSGINDLVTFEAESVQELELAFKQAVDDYLESCRNINKIPQTPSGLS